MGEGIPQKVLSPLSVKQQDGGFGISPWGFSFHEIPYCSPFNPPVTLPLPCLLSIFLSWSIFSDKPRGLRAVREEMRRSSSIEPYSCLSLTMEIKSDRHMMWSWNSGRKSVLFSLGTTKARCSSHISWCWFLDTPLCKVKCNSATGCRSYRQERCFSGMRFASFLSN